MPPTHVSPSAKTTIGHDLTFYEREDIAIEVAKDTGINTRPRKTLGWKTPTEALDQLLEDVHIEGVATTG